MLGVENLGIGLRDMTIHKEDGIYAGWAESVRLDLLPIVPNIGLGTARLLVVITLS